jgi:hypothetical protein
VCTGCGEQFAHVDELCRLACEEFEVICKEIDAWERRRTMTPKAANALAWLGLCMSRVEGLVAYWHASRGEPLPDNPSLRMVVDDSEEQGFYQDVCDHCERAKKAGWPGDWDERIARARKAIESVTDGRPLTAARVDLEKITAEVLRRLENSDFDPPG